MRKHPELFSHIEQESKKGKTPKEQVAIAEQLAKNEKALPNYSWMIDHGHNGVYQAMKKYPDLFAHIEWKSNEKVAS